MKEFIFKLLGYEDLEKVMILEQSSFAKNTWEDKSVYEERIRVFPEGNFGIWLNGVMIGFISSELWSYEENYNKKRFMLSHSIEEYHSYDGEELYISSFAISKTYRGNGFGKEIFKIFLKKMKSMYSLKSSILLVSEEWGSAKKVYESYGYEVQDYIDEFFINDFSEKFSGIIMRKYF